jgi:hypothetical protein
MGRRLPSAAHLLPVLLLAGCASGAPPADPGPAPPAAEDPPRGSPDLVPLLEGIVARGGRTPEGESVRDLHRIALPDHLPALVLLLEPASGETWRDLLWLLRNLADNTDRHRETVAGALLYARAAWVAEVEGRPAPRLADFPFPGKGPATAAAFRARREALLGGQDPSEIHEEFPHAWLERWERQDAGGPPAERTPAEAPEALTAEEARARAAELGARPVGAWLDDDRSPEDLLPLLEVAAPDALDALLARWAEDPDGDARALVAEWRRRRATAPDPAGEAEALLAALGRGEEPGPSVARLGRLGARGRPVLERLRRDRESGLRWAATAGLAISGDVAARAEFLAMLRADRISIFDTELDEVGLTLDGDPEVLDHWLSRTDANCCLRFRADQALRSLHPTMPEADTVADTDDGVRRVREWFARWRGRLRWSRLAGGWVPAAE